VCGIALVPVVFVYGRLAERLPGAASEVAYTAAAFPSYISFATGWAMAFANAIVCPYEAVSMGQVTAYLFPGMKTWELYEIAGQPVYLPHLLLGLGTTAVILSVNYRGVRQSARLQNLTTLGLLAIFALFTILGLSHGRVENLTPPFANSDGEAKGAFRSVLSMLAVAPYFMMGFETIPKCSDEAAREFEARRFLRIMLWALAVATFFYIAVVGVVGLLQPWPTLLVKDQFPIAVAFEKVFHAPWLVQLIMVGVVLSLVKVFNGNFLASTRLLYAMGRRDLLGGQLGTVHARHGTPTVAIALVGMVTVAGTFLGKAVLEPISEVGSLCGGAVWLATSLAYFCGAGGKATPGMRWLGGTGALISLALMTITAADFGRYHWLALAAWAAVGGALWLARRPQPIR
jgi:basic amino acid/polyamine antiporter, APA family